MPDSELEHFREQYLLTQELQDQYRYRKALLDRGYGIRETQLRIGDIVEVNERIGIPSPRNFEADPSFFWIQSPQPWIGEIRRVNKGSLHPMCLEGFLEPGPRYWFDKEAIKDLKNAQLIDLDQIKSLIIIPLQKCIPTSYAEMDWGLQIVTPRGTSLPIYPNQVRLLDPFNPQAPANPPLILRCHNCDLRLIGFYFYQNGYASCSQCKLPLPRTGEKRQNPISETIKTILIIEDHRDLRESFKELLEDEGYRVLEASQGLEALQILSQESDNICLIIMDWNMPVMNGPKFLLKKEINPDFQQIPTIVMTGMPLENPNLPSVVKVLIKPIIVGQFLDEVQKVC